jgi:hypothetical protein
MSTIRRLCLAAAFFALAAGLAMAPIAEALAKSCGQLLNTEIAQSGAGQFTTSSIIFANVVGSNVSFNVAGASPSCVIVSFSAQAFAQNRTGMHVRALLDNNVESVDGVVIFVGDSGAFPEAHAYNFLFPSVSPGPHTVKMQYRSHADGFPTVINEFDLNIRHR